jgi:phospholipase/carboxylesterase
MTETLSLDYRFVPARREGLRPLLMLHGTGGNENDLLPLAERLSPGAAVLSPRGAVLENGMPRFFRRLAEGVFDEADLVARTRDLAGFVAQARARYGLAAPVAVGFSNGANIAASLLMLHPGVLAGAVLLRAMRPFAVAPRAAASPAGTPVLVLSGSADPIVSAASREGLVAQLDAAGARVTEEVLPAGHGLTSLDADIATDWLHSW